ncbi:MAG: DNA polymerase III subunit [Firmicutes bacterium]|nr:DNA polymerase III subunit [Bacillota bacterium]
MEVSADKVVLTGHEACVRHLRAQVLSGKVSHAYLVEGAEGAGKKTLCRQFARALVCQAPRNGEACGRCDSCRVFLSENHPDVHYIRPDEKGNLPVQMIREELVHDIDILPYYEGRKVYVIEQAQNLSVQAQNVILKTIEEPPAYAVILLLAESVQSFLPTVRSRCVMVRLLPLPEDKVAGILQKQYGVDRTLAEKSAAFCGGSVGQALKAAGSQEYKELRARWMERLGSLAGGDPYRILGWDTALEEDKAHIQEILRMCMVWFRDLILVRETGSTSACICRDRQEALRQAADAYDIPELYRKVRVLEEARRKLEHNVNYALWSDWLLMKLSVRRSI